MKSKLCLSFLSVVMFIFVSTVCRADVTIEMGDLSKHQIFVTYSDLKIAQGGATSYSLEGFALNANIKIVGVRDVDTDQSLKAELTKDKNGQNIKCYFIHPIPQSGSVTVEVKLSIENPNWFYGDKNKVTISYSSAWPAFVILPAGYAAVYCNLPVLIFEKHGKTVLSNKGNGKRRNIEIIAKHYEGLGSDQEK